MLPMEFPWNEADSAADLVVYCEKENVPHTTFASFSDILSDVKDVVSGKVSVKDTARGWTAGRCATVWTFSSFISITTDDRLDSDQDAGPR